MTGLRKSSLLPLGEILHRSSYLHAFKVDLGGRLSIDRSDVVKLLKNSIFNMLGFFYHKKTASIKSLKEKLILKLVKELEKE